MINVKANDETTRRRFLEGSAGVGAGHVASSLLSARSSAAVVGANDRVQIGVIGTGGRASQLIDHLIPKPVQGGIPQWKTKPDALTWRRRPMSTSPIATRLPPGPVRKRPSSTTIASSWNKRKCKP